MAKKRSEKHKKIKPHNPVPQPKTIKAKPIVFGFFILLFITVIAIVNTQASVTGQAIAKQNINNLNAGTSIFIEIKNIQGIEGITAELSGKIQKSYILVEQTDKQKIKNIYNSFIISSPDRKNINRVVLNLKIKETDLQKLGINPRELKIQNNELTLNPILMKQERGYVYYTVQSNRLGTFTYTK